MKTLLVALDGSERSPDVLRAAAALARRTGARLILLRAVGIPVPLPVEAYRVSPSELPGLLEQHALDWLQEVGAQLPEGLLAGVRVRLSNAWQAICDAAREEAADLIVIGAHGYGVVDRMLGTTAAKVVNHADRAVLVVRAAERLEA